MADLRTLTEFELIGRLQASDHAAYNEIYHRYFQLIYTHAYKKLQDEDQAKDITQEVFATLWFKRETASQIKNLAAYLFTATRNRIFDLFAHQKVETRYSDSLKNFIAAQQTLPTDHLIRERQLQAYIAKEIQELPPRMRQIFEMSRNENLSHKEIADQLGTSQNNVSTQITSALRILRTKLGLIAIIFTMNTWL